MLPPFLSLLCFKIVHQLKLVQKHYKIRAYVHFTHFSSSSDIIFLAQLSYSAKMCFLSYNLCVLTCTVYTSSEILRNPKTLVL